MSKIPSAVLAHSLFQYLEPDGVAACAGVCRSWNVAAHQLPEHHIRAVTYTRWLKGESHRLRWERFVLCTARVRLCCLSWKPSVCALLQFCVWLCLFLAEYADWVRTDASTCLTTYCTTFSLDRALRLQCSPAEANLARSAPSLWDSLILFVCNVLPFSTRCTSDPQIEQLSMQFCVVGNEAEKVWTIFLTYSVVAAPRNQQ